jgi:plasmid replication initiation protein
MAQNPSPHCPESSDRPEHFVADIVDPSLRDQIDIMALPFFSLQKPKRTKPIHYRQNGIEAFVSGGTEFGIATIWDADFLIWIASQLNEAARRGISPSRTIRVIPYRFLLTTRRIHPRAKGGKAYRDFERLLDRLRNTNIKTNIRAGGTTITRSFSWISDWLAVKDRHDRIIRLEVELCEWFFSRIIHDRAILSIHPDYFHLTGGIERWLYRTARKHCGGNRDGWSFTVRKLHQRYPPGRPYRKFKADIRSVVESDSIPEYHTHWDTVGAAPNATDWVHFTLRPGALITRRLPCSLRLVDNS